jgi:hypothetical protein
MLNTEQFDKLSKVLDPICNKIYNSIDSIIERPYHPGLLKRNINARTTVYIEGYKDLKFQSFDFFATTDFNLFLTKVALHIDKLTDLLLQEDDDE